MVVKFVFFLLLDARSPDDQIAGNVTSARVLVLLMWTIHFRRRVIVFRVCYEGHGRRAEVWMWLYTISMGIS